MPQKPEVVYFFGTCLIDTLYPKAGMASIQLLQREGVQVIFPQDQSCCGQPAFNSGYRDEARKVALVQLALFTKNIPIVVPSCSCAGMIKHHYPMLFAGTRYHQQAKEVANRVFELTEFLVDVLDIQLIDLGVPRTVAIHTSCSARREMAVADRIEQLVGQLENIEVKEPAYKSECCGFGGTFAIKQPEISAAMVEDKTRHLQETGADIVVSQDCGCLMNIGGVLKYQKSAVQTEYVASFLWNRTAEKASC